MADIDLDAIRPPEALKAELLSAAHSALRLREALKGANHLPDSFPCAEMDAVAATLERLADQTRFGALTAMAYAHDSLSALRRQHMAFEGQGGAVERGGALDRALKDLMADLSTGIAFYSEPEIKAAKAASLSDQARAQGDAPHVAQAAESAAAMAKAAHDFNETSKAHLPQDRPEVEALQRGAQDVETLGEQQTLELTSPAPRPALVERLNKGLRKAVPVIQWGLRGIQLGCKAGKIILDGVSRYLVDELGKGLLDNIDRTAGQLNDLIEREKKGSRKPAPSSSFAPLSIFRDRLKSGGEGPEMVMIPTGEFWMGSTPEEQAAAIKARMEQIWVMESPRHLVKIERSFALCKYAVTFEEYDLFCERTGRKQPEDRWSRRRMPAINVNWGDAAAYCAWLSGQTGEEYRLPSEAEWEYACRAGSKTPFEPTVAHRFKGASITPKEANYDGNYPYGDARKGEYRQKTVAVDHAQFRPNAWGLWQMHGNVWEWCEDLWHDNYKGAPADGSAWLSGSKSGVRARVVRGGSWDGLARSCRAAARLRLGSAYRFVHLGFRLARTLKSP